MTTFAIDQQLKRDTAADWTSNNPTLLAGEIGWETDYERFKIGDGSTAWTSLPYAGGTPWEALIHRNSDHNSQDFTTATLYAGWNEAIYDRNGGTNFWGGTGSNPSRLSVPLGCDKVILTAQVRLTSFTTGDMDLQIRKNGSTFDGMPRSRLTAPSSGEWAAQVASLPLDVVGGTDYFEFRLAASADSSVNIPADFAWFGIKRVH